MTRFRPCLALLCATLLIATCAPAEKTASMPDSDYVVADLEAFEAFMATRPTPAQFRARYPQVTLILPGDAATQELRRDRSRFFAHLNPDGRIIGGRFQ